MAGGLGGEGCVRVVVVLNAAVAVLVGELEKARVLPGAEPVRAVRVAQVRGLFEDGAVLDRLGQVQSGQGADRGGGRVEEGDEEVEGDICYGGARVARNPR